MNSISFEQTVQLGEKVSCLWQTMRRIYAICNDATDPLKTHLSSTHYYADFDHSKSSHMGFSRGTKNWGAWVPDPSPGWERGWPVTNTTCPHMNYHAEFDHCWSNDASVHMEVYWKNWDPCVTAFKSLGITGNDMNWLVPRTFYKRSVVTTGLSCTISKI